MATISLKQVLCGGLILLQTALAATALPPSVYPKITMDDALSEPEAKYVKVRYGPYTIRAGKQANARTNTTMHKPCEECYITAFQGDMEYADGSNANVDTNAYLHHFVLSNDGKKDALCSRKTGFPSYRRQWIYNTGNERPPVRLNGKHKFGMRIDKADKFSALAEFMNMSDKDQDYYITIIFETVPLNTTGYREATHFRVDLTECGGSHVAAKEGVYEYNSQPWTSPWSGVLLHNDGHAHSGGTNSILYRNGEVLCDSVLHYGLEPEWIQPAGGHAGHGGNSSDSAGTKYISHNTMCRDSARIEKGDELFTKSKFDGDLRPQMYYNGELDAQMGISFVYIGRDEDTLEDVVSKDPNGMRYPVEYEDMSAEDAEEAEGHEHGYPMVYRH